MPHSSYFSCALITGASSGLGAEFARQLAPRCAKLVLLARREAPMIGLAEEIRAAPEVDAVVYVEGAMHLKAGDIVPVKITGADDYDLYAALA